MKLQLLIENTASAPDIRAEHGLSIYIETGAHRILFDMGQSGGFADNAEKMHVELARVDIAILSHGHYDHGGGLSRFFEVNDLAPVYMQRTAFEPHFAVDGRYIGLDPALKASGRIKFVDEYLQLDAGLELHSSAGMPLLHGAARAGMFVKRGEALLPDDFRHEQYLSIYEGGKRIAISGCSHNGILNIAEWLKPDVLVGGFHFKDVDPLSETGRALLIQTADELSAYPTAYYTCHCTGRAQYALMHTRMGERLHYLASGAGITI